MTIGWMTILRNVPWTDVIRNAPAVADGARKLWRKVGGGKGGEGEAEVSAPTETAEATPDVQLARLKQRVDELHGQMVASSELIRALAEQNAQLIARIERNHRYLWWLVLGNGIALCLAVAAWLP